MPRIKETTVFQYDELSENAKEKALDWYGAGAFDYSWWEFVYEDAEGIGLKITSFDLDRGRSIEGELTEYCHKVAKNIIEKHGESCETYKLAKVFLDKKAGLDAIIQKTSECAHRDDAEPEENYKHDLCDECWLNQEAAEDGYAQLEADFDNDLKQEYLSMLGKEYEWLTSRESMEESIRANEYEFDEDGNRA